MNVHDPSQFSTAGVATGLTITWAATSHVEADRLPLGKVYAKAGKWGVTPAVQRPGKANVYAYEVAAYRDLEELADDALARIGRGCWTMVAGVPRPELELALLHRRLGLNFTDAPVSTYVIDIDGMLPAKGQDLSTPEAFGDLVIDVFRARLAKAGIKSLANAKLVLLATASSGFPTNSRGEPAKGRAWFRIIFELSTALTLGQQKALTAALGKLPGFKSMDPGKTTCLDTDIHSLAGNIFVAPTQGIADPIESRVWTFPAEGNAADAVDVDQLVKELKLAEVPPVEPEAPRKPKGERLMQVPPEQREALLSGLVRALPNEKDFGRKKFIGVAHAIWGAADGEAWAYDIFAEWCARWPGVDDPLVDEKAWNTLKDGENGYDYLKGWAVNVGTPECLVALAAIGAASFNPIPIPDPDPDPDETKPKKKRFESLKRFIARFKPVAYVVDELLAAGSLYTLTGITGTGKTGWLTSAVLAVVTGRKDILNRKVMKGRAAFCTAENPDGLLMRLAVTASTFGVDIHAIGNDLIISKRRITPEDIYVELKAEAEENGPLAMVIVDTWQAFFDGNDSNKPSEALAFTLRWRPLTRLPGNPTVVIATHPIKNATPDQLIPYGGGSILNEVDGNLTLALRPGGIIRMHWLRKLRGLEFEPPLYRIDTRTAPGIVNIEGDLVRIPVMFPVTAEEAEATEEASVNRDAQVLRFLAENPLASERDLASAVGVAKTTVRRALNRLAKVKPALVKYALGKWVVTKAGKDALKPHVKEDENEDNEEE